MTDTHPRYGTPNAEGKAENALFETLAELAATVSRDADVTSDYASEALVTLVGVPRPLTVLEWHTLMAGGNAISDELDAALRAAQNELLAASLVEESDSGHGQYQPTRAGAAVVAQWLVATVYQPSDSVGAGMGYDRAQPRTYEEYVELLNELTHHGLLEICAQDDPPIRRLTAKGRDYAAALTAHSGVDGPAEPLMQGQPDSTNRS